MWGMSALLPEAVGIRLAKEMTLTGRFLQPKEALQCGLVNHIVDHDRLVAFAVQLAEAMTSSDPAVVAAWLDVYDAGAGESRRRRLELEGRAAQPGGQVKGS
jgi:enoyl-CoA hydratase